MARKHEHRRRSSCRRRLAEKHGFTRGDVPSDELIEDLARHYSFTVYHLTSTCRIGSVVDPQLRVLGVEGLRVADASVMPNVVSGNTNAASIMIGEKAAEMVAADHGIQLGLFVGAVRQRRVAGQAGRCTERVACPYRISRFVHVDDGDGCSLKRLPSRTKESRDSRECPAG